MKEGDNMVNVNIRIIALIVKGKSIIGYRFYLKEGVYKDLPVRYAAQLIKEYGCVNAIISENRILGTECALFDLPFITKEGEIVKNDSIIILDTNDGESYVVTDYSALTLTLGLEEVRNYIKSVG